MILRLGLLVLVVLLASCGGPVCTPGQTQQPREVGALVGQVRSFTLGLTHACDRSARLSAVVTALDPDGAAQPVAATEVRFDDSSAPFVEVTLTPTKPGRHRVDARFEPQLGTSVADVVAAN